jgi:colanic acid/amylovoran biosynthesis protein
MHSNIFSLSEGVPVIAIGYQPKTRGIIQMVGLERWMIDIERVSGQTLIGLLAALWDERDAVREHLRRTIPLLIQQGNQAGAMVAADFAALHAHGRSVRCL